MAAKTCSVPTKESPSLEAIFLARSIILLRRGVNGWFSDFILCFSRIGVHLWSSVGSFFVFLIWSDWLFNWSRAAKSFDRLPS